MEGEEHHWLVSCNWERYVALSKVRYITLLLVTFCGRWGETWIGEFASEEGIVTCERLGTHFLYLVTFCGRWRAPLVRELFPRKVCSLHNVSFSPLAFVYILWKVKSTIGWWIASEEFMLSWLRLGTLPCFCLHSVEGEELHWLVNCIWGMYGDLVKVSYSPVPLFTFCGSWRAPLVGELHLRNVWCPGYG